MLQLVFKMEESDQSTSGGSPGQKTAVENGDQPSTILAYPLPPMQYIENIDPDKLPSPPSPISDGFYHMFGQKISLYDAIIAPLEAHGTKRLYPKSEYDHKKELKKINASILVNFLDLIDVLVKCPDTEKRMEKCNDLASLFINFHHLINELRPHQARETLRVWLVSQRKSRDEITKKLNAEMDKMTEILDTYQKFEKKHEVQHDKNQNESEQMDSCSRGDVQDSNNGPQANRDDSVRSIDDIMCDIIDDYCT